jgi:hypothetical protein
VESFEKRIRSRFPEKHIYFYLPPMDGLIQVITK